MDGGMGWDRMRWMDGTNLSHITRVPFVLPEDFIYVISNGNENPKKSKEFDK